jgi:hypothetical protein
MERVNWPYRPDRRPPARNRWWGMASLSSTSTLHPDLQVFADGTKIAADLNNL